MAEFKLRVVLSAQVIKKVILSEKPADLQELYRQLVDKVEGMPQQFMLMYSDPDFDNSLVSLEDIRDLKNCGSVTVMHIDELPSSAPLEGEFVASSSGSANVLRTVSTWPDPFILPEFDVTVEMQLNHAEDGFRVPWALKRDILHKLALSVHAIKAYPSRDELAGVAKALVMKYPCLYEKGTINGWSGWHNSLIFKMGNFRTTLNKLGCTEVAVNARKRVTEPRVDKKVKKPKRNEVNFLPNVSSTEGEVETLCRSLRDNFFQQPMDAAKLATEIAETFAARRQEIVCEKPTIASVVSRWPALFLTSQVAAEFRRITNVDIGVFYTMLDLHLDKLHSVFSHGTGKKATAMKELMDSFSGNMNDIVIKRSCILRCIPLYFGETPDCLYKDFMSIDDDNFGPGQFVAVCGDPMQPDCISIVVEGDVVIDDVTDLPTAVCLFLLCITY